MASLLGRIIVVQPHNIGLVWPAAGVALVWLASSTRRLWKLDLALLALSTFTVLLLTDGGLVRSLLSVTGVLQAALAVWLLRRWVPGIWGTGGRAPFSRPAQFGMIVLAGAVATLAAQLLRSALGLAFVPDEVPSLILGRFGRQTAALATVGVFGLLLGGVLAQHRDSGRPMRRPSRADLLHLTGITTATTTIFVFGFWLNPQIPTTFMLALTVVWTAVRFSPLVTATHSLLTGALAVLVTILGYGPIAGVGSPEVRALLAQILVVVLMVIGLTIALTRRQLFETIDRLRLSESTVGARAAELDLMLSRLGDGVAIVEEGGRYVQANDALRRIMSGQPGNGAAPGEVASPTAYPLFHTDGRPVADEEYPYVRALAGTEVVDEPFHVRRPPATDYRVVEVSAFPLPDEPDVPRRAMVVVRDVTVAATHRESLVAFAGTVAHDLNNPLSVVDGWAEAIEEDLAESESAEAAAAAPMVQHIRSSVAQMRSLISDLLAHAVARDQRLQCELVPLRNMIKHIAATRDRPHAGTQIVTGELHDVWADKVLVRQVLDNLIGNAMKYVAPGVAPRVEIDSREVRPGWVEVRVCDNGIGIAPEDRERVFDRFQRLTPDNYQGTGLGLSICKRIIERHGGTIEVTDNADGGSCFVLTLPTSQSALLGATRA